MKAINVFSAMMERKYISIKNEEVLKDLELTTNIFKVHSCEESCLSVYHLETEEVFYDIMYEDIKLY